MTTALLRSGVMVCVLLMLNACGTDLPDQARTFQYNQDAGAVFLAPGTIAPWQSYMDSLQPSFAITPDSALKMALPVTAFSQEALVNAVNGGLSVGLPSSSSTGTNSLGTSSNSATANGVATDSSSNTSATSAGSSYGPGTAPALPAAGSVPSAIGLPVPSGTLAQDAVQQYTAATAIYQEIQILNAYLKDGAFRHNYVPYILRMPVNIEAYAHKEPYDVYLDGSVFAQCGMEDVKANPALVIPLLMSDDLENSQGTSAADIVRQLGASLGGTVQNVALRAQLQTILNRYNAMLGQQSNSLLTVTRGDGDNVFHARIGARINFSSQYEMVTQTHNITVVVGIPVGVLSQGKCTAPGGLGLAVTMTSTFRDARTAKALKVSSDRIVAQINEMTPRFFENPIDTKTIIDLLNAVQKGDTADFQAKLKPLYLRQETGDAARAAQDVSDNFEAFWTAMSVAITSSEFSQIYVGLPDTVVPPIGATDDQADRFRKQLVVLKDADGSASTSLAGFGATPLVGMQAVLKCSDELTIPATSLTRGAPNGPLTIQFPALAPLEKACTGTDSDDTKLRPWPGKTLLVFNTDGDPRWNGVTTAPYTLTQVYFAPKPQEKKAAFTVSPASDTVSADNTGKGNLRLLLDGLDALKKVVITAKGGAIVSVDPASSSAGVSYATGQISIVATPKVPPDPKDPKATALAKPMMVDVTLSGLIPGHILIFSASGTPAKDGDAVSAAPINVPVVAQQQPASK